MLFSDIIGQIQIKEQLTSMVSNGKIPHALLFLGPPGCGKLTLALALSQYVLCQNRTAEDACGQCPNCLKAQKYIHPDIHFSFPTIGSKATSNDFLDKWREALKTPYFELNDWLQLIGAENKQGNITKDECLQIIKKISLKVFEGSHKILIMWKPELLGKEGNRLLKLIEEPPSNTIFILVAENQEALLNTILSRCQLIKINALSEQEIKEALIKNWQVAPGRAEAVSTISEGNLGQAIKLADSNENDLSKMFLNWMRLCYMGNGVQLVKWVENIAKIGRENQKQFIHYALHFMGELLRVKLIGTRAVKLGEQERETAQKMSGVVGLNQIEHITELLNDCYYHIERNANSKILFLDLSISVHHHLKKKKMEKAQS